jgi:hypothetical protein
MAKLSHRVRRQAKRAIRNLRASSEENVPNNTVRKSTSFPYSEGSLVQFRRDYSSYGDANCPRGTMCLVMTSPTPSPYNSSIYLVDVMVNGALVCDVPAKILLLQGDESE